MVHTSCIQARCSCGNTHLRQEALPTMPPPPELRCTRSGQSKPAAAVSPLLRLLPHVRLPCLLSPYSFMPIVCSVMHGWFCCNIPWRCLVILPPLCTGAELANVINEAALEAARRNGTEITSIGIYNAMDRILQVGSTDEHLLQ